MLVCYTDGITEARAPDGTTFELARLEHALQNRVGLPMAAVVNGVVDDVARFTAGAPQEDDVAVLGLRYR
jgi:sigma-B regulation protein RsbU (phosphoserine phosphatase)